MRTKAKLSKAENASNGREKVVPEFAETDPRFIFFKL
jgi:hypothetical protein